MNKKIRIIPTDIDGLLLVEREPILDFRGSFERIYCSATLEESGFIRDVRQINRSVTQKAGTLRGLHYQQPPYSEDKVVSCLRGEVFDVAVDLRRDSPTFLKWYGQVLSSRNHLALIVPKGFAHGFQSLCDDSEVLYINSEKHTPEAERGFQYSDSKLAINWPLPVTKISNRDLQWPLMNENFEGLSLW